MSSSKGKEKVIEGKSVKRKNEDDSYGAQKRRNRAVLQLFEDSAFEVDGESSEDEDDFDVADFLEDESFDDVKANNEPVKVPLVPFIKEEEMDDAELERMVEERYGRGSSFVRYAEDGYNNTEAVDRDDHLPFPKDPILWKVKCMVGREKHSVFCLMQKFVDLRTLGTKLQIISAFSLDHVKGFIFIETETQQDLYEACKGLSTVYFTRVTPIPPNERSHVLAVRSKGCGITAGMWARVKSGKYKGDLAQIVAVNEARKKATVKLVPRIDLRALAEKFGGGVSMKRGASTHAPSRLISSSELEEFRPLIQTRRDRDTNLTVEVLDGMLLKDGYLYKKIGIDSLSVWGAMPTEDELLKFEPPNNNESMDLEFLSDLYGNANKKKKQIMKNDKVGEKGEGSSTSKVEYSFDVHDLVFFGKKDFGVIIGMEKDDNFKIMKEGTEGLLVLSLPARELKSASFDKKLFTAQDRHMKKISISDRVRVMDGPLKDKEGVVKRIYRGIIFLFNESEEDHNGYICFKSHTCEKVISAGQASHEQGNEPGPSGFGESPSSPNSPLSTKKPWQERENSSFNQEDSNAMFSVGQSLRIKVGPLKGYLCRVLAIRRSDITVKLDSQHKILTVKSEHLSEVRGRSSANVTGGGQESAEPFDLLGTADGSRDWATGTTESRGWNVGAASTEGTSWPSFPSSGNKLQSENGAVTDTIGGDSGWAAAAAETGQVDGWGKQDGSTSVAATGASDSWGKAVESRNENIGQGSAWGGDTGGVDKAAWNSEPAMDKQAEGWSNVGSTEASGWTKPARKDENQTSWGNKKSDTGGGACSGQGGGSTWGKAPESESAATTKEDSSWGGKAEQQQSNKDGDGGSSWGKRDGGSSWNKKDSESTWSKQTEGSSWGKKADAKPEESRDQADNNKSWGNQGGSSWNKQDGGSPWKGKDGGSDTGNPTGGSSWGKQAEGSSWGKKADAKPEESQDQADNNKSWGNQGGSSWNKQDGGAPWKGKDGGSDTGKPTGGSSWGKQVDDRAEDLHGKADRNESWGSQGGSSWKKQDSGPAGGSAWGLQAGAKAEEPNNTADQTQGWGKQGEGSLNKQDGGSSWGKPAGGSSWGQQADTNVKPRSDESVDGKEGGNNWSAAKPSDGSTAGWEMKSNSFNKTQSSGWGNSSSLNQNSAGNSADLEKRDQSDSWDVKKTSEGGSSTGWGKGNWGKSSTDDAPGNQSSSWSSKSNWGAGNDYSGSQDQVDNFSRGGGRGGSWRGGRGGRGESDGDNFGGRGGSGRGGYRGRGGSFGGRDGSERGGYGGRGGSFGGRDGSERGGYGGRGRSDRGGFRGRGRGRSDYGGDWNNRNDSGEEKPSWSKSSWNADGGRSNENKGNWNQGDADSGQNKGWSSGSQGADGDGGQRKSWGSGGGWSKPGNNGGWNQGSASGGDADGDGGQKKSWGSGGSWSKPDNSAGWNQGSASGSGNNDGGDGGQKKSWGSGGSGSKPDNSANWNQGSAPGSGNNDGGDGGQKKSWGASGSSAGWNQGSAPGSGNNDGGDGDGGQKNSSSGGGWSKPDSNAGWNQGAASGSGNTSGAWNKPGNTDGSNTEKVNDASESGGPTDSWGNAAASSWGKSKGGW